MIRTPINKDIGKIRNKDVWLFTWREAIYSGIAIVVGGATCFLLYPYIGISAAAWISMICVMPIAGVGFFNFNGLTLLDIVKEVIFNPKAMVFGGDFEEEKRELERELHQQQKREKKREKKRGKAWDYLIIKRQKNQDSSCQRKSRMQ